MRQAQKLPPPALRTRLKKAEEAEAAAYSAWRKASGRAHERPHKARRAKKLLDEARGRVAAIAAEINGVHGAP